MKKILGTILSMFLLVSFASAQTAEVTVQLNEQFFNTLLDAVFTNSAPPEFPIADAQPSKKKKKSAAMTAFSETVENRCNEKIRLLREIDGVKTSVNFRGGQIAAPIAFSGNYNPPLIGCVPFSGVAQTSIVLEFDQNRQALVGRARVSDVSLSGTGGVGSSILARLVQSSIDKKINPIEILPMEKLSFVVPIQNSSGLRMKAIGMRHQIQNGVLNVTISYKFQKA